MSSKLWQPINLFRECKNTCTGEVQEGVYILSNLQHYALGEKGKKYRRGVKKMVNREKSET